MTATKDGGRESDAISAPADRETLAIEGPITHASGVDLPGVRELVRLNMRMLRRCFDTYASADPSPVVVAFTFDRNGSVFTVSADTETYALKACLSGIVRDIRFPKPAAASDVAVAVKLTPL